MRSGIVHLTLLATLGVGCSSSSDTASTAATDTTSAAGDAATAGATFALTSEAVVDGVLQDAFRCETKDANGSSDSIPLAWSGVPVGTGSLAITMHHYPNPDDTTKPPNSYLALWNIDPTVTSIAHGKADDGPWYMGSNKDGKGIGYTSPCSPSGAGHMYTVTIYALSATPESLPTKSDLSITWTELTQAFAAVETLGTATLTFVDGAE